jgi:hypothetical protein
MSGNATNRASGITFELSVIHRLLFQRYGVGLILRRLLIQQGD